MFKRFLTFATVVLIAATIIPQTIVSALQATDVIKSVSLSSDTFDPAKDAPLDIEVVFNDAKLNTYLKTSSGSVSIMNGKNKTVVRKLVGWSAGEFEKIVGIKYGTKWDGKANDGGVCTDICDAGEYYVKVYLDLGKTGEGEIIEAVDTSAVFTITEATPVPDPSPLIENLTIDKSTFDPSKNETVTISYNVNIDGKVTVEALNSTPQSVELIKDKQVVAPGSKTATWDGKKADGTPFTNGAYKIKVTLENADASKSVTEEIPVTVEVPAPVLDFSIDEFTLTTVSGETYLDPSVDSSDVLNIDYKLSKAENSYSIEVRFKNSDDRVIHTIDGGNGAKTTGSFSWNGADSDSVLVSPDTYDVILVVTNSNGTPIAEKEKSIEVKYPSSDKPDISEFTVSPTSFDPDFESVKIDFANVNYVSAYYLEVWDSSGDTVTTFGDYNGDSSNNGSSHSVTWEGTTTNGGDLGIGTYKVVLKAVNDDGVVEMKKTVTLTSAGSSCDSGNTHIDGISFKPSSTFEPEDDDEMEIEFDIKQELDDLQVLAVQGSEKIVIEDYGKIEKNDVENNVELFWDGTDDSDDYVDDGTWQIQFRTTLGNTDLVACRSIKVEYEKPEVEEIEISKSKFDNDLGEFTYVMFKVDADAEVDIELYNGNNHDETLEEEIEVEKDHWYAYEWDGDGFDYDDDPEFRIVAKNKVNPDIQDVESESVDLAEDDPSSNKSNVTQDYISPVLTNGSQPMGIYYNLEDDADVKITIHKGKSLSGSVKKTILDIKDQDSGDHSVTWDGKDDSGKKLTSGFYTYKIVSKKSGGSSDTESGIFIVDGKIGNIEGTASGVGSFDDNDDDGNSSDGIASGVVVDGEVPSSSDDDTDDGSGSSDDGDSSDVDFLSTPGALCAGFLDVPGNSSYCEAITWARGENIFVGYPDGTFRPGQTINRVELLKVAVESTGLPVTGNNFSDYGYSDVHLGEWYLQYIGTGLALGIFHGDASGLTARPGDSVNRVEALKLIFEGIRVSSGQTAGSCVPAPYTDVQPGIWFYNYACEASSYGLFSETGTGQQLFPSKFASRAEVAMMLYQLHEAGLFL